ncbi:hypothetical protein trd_A0717 (plasmid) [Thermomicrobium roseum DSM 5159]|uniref:Uncharacterized protein n=1 Tax=Thermomicrobium roseum (strain ATCC 27502 / DSM 5159 / P-2) TaxID=309801 RepID=B9L4K3_THERP|nr:hypothetical protein trd_A0717 [Thermomicrobium roseum DSM 5159]
MGRLREDPRETLVVSGTDRVSVSRTMTTGHHFRHRWTLPTAPPSPGRAEPARTSRRP